MPPLRDDNEAPEMHRRPQHPPQPLPLPYAFSNSQQMKIWAKHYRTEIAAGGASLASTFLTFPLDTIKTKLQTHADQFSGVSDCIKQTYRNDKIGGFWKGVTAPLLSVTLVRTVSMSIYQQAKYFFDDQIYKLTGTSPLVVANTRGAYPNIYTVACFGLSGAIAGGAITVISCPFELTKMAQQIAEDNARKRGRNTDAAIIESYRNKGTFRTAEALWKNRGGVRGLYSGVSYHLLRDTIGTAVYFITYESVKQLLANSRGDAPTSPSAVAAAGGICGIVSWICIFPIDTAKQQYQKNCISQKRDSTDKVSIDFFSRNRYRALAVSIGRSATLNMIFFSFFEFGKKRINALKIGVEDDA